jgi:heavy metal translocating P-type ATPase
MNAALDQPCCDYCGLPLGRGWFGRAAAIPSHQQKSSERLYCCSGCRLADEIARSRGDKAPTAMLTRLGFAIFLTMNVVCFTMILWSGDVYADGDPARTRTSALLADLFRYLSLLFSMPVVWLLAGPLGRNSWQQLRRGAPATDVLLVLGIGAAFVSSILAVFRGEGHVYFEVGCVVLVFVTLGRWLETTGKQQANAALDALTRLLPATVRKIVGQREQIISLEEVSSGDRLRLLPGERVPVDGRILQGQAAIDEQFLTGESLPAIKEPGDPVFGGALNLDGQLIIEAASSPLEGTLQRLVDAVTQARRTKSRYQRLADRVATIFLPLTLAIAVATFAWHSYRSGFEQGLFASMAVMLIACPCALGLATPLAVWSALGGAARRQILFRHGEALERMAAVRAVFFDKTGTLTTGVALVDRLATEANQLPSQVHQVAHGLASASAHPLSIAIASETSQFADDQASPAVITAIAGRGVMGQLCDGQRGYLGSLRWMKELRLTLPGELEHAAHDMQKDGMATVYVGWSGLVRGVYGCSEALRPETKATLQQLRSRGLHLECLSGDDPTRAKKLSARLKLDIQAGLLPEEKVATLKLARLQWKSTAMVGDGINDAPALATADVGIAMGCGADVSREAADVCLMSSNLEHLVAAFALARRTVRVIRQNLFWAFAYNTLGIALAATGKLNPMWAAAAMTISSILVIGNSLRLADEPGPCDRNPDSQPDQSIPDTKAVGGRL